MHAGGWMSKFHVRYTRIRIVMILAKYWLHIILLGTNFASNSATQRGRVHNNKYLGVTYQNISAPTTYRWNNDTHMGEEESLPNLGPLDFR
jgi:hypothetical protein